VIELVGSCLESNVKETVNENKGKKTPDDKDTKKRKGDGF
jgi:hypothetical protein